MSDTKQAPSPEKKSEIVLVEVGIAPAIAQQMLPLLCTTGNILRLKGWKPSDGRRAVEVDGLRRTPQGVEVLVRGETYTLAPGFWMYTKSVAA